MLNPIREVSEEERNKRALIVLEGITHYYCFGVMSEEEKKKYADEFWSCIYKITHSVTAHTCSTVCPIAKEGLDEIEEWEKTLKEGNIVDVEKEMLGQCDVSENPTL